MGLKKILPESIIKDYNDGMYIKDMLKKYNVHHQTLTKNLLYYGVEISEKSRSRNNYFNEISTPQQAYILGWTITDGHLNKNSNRLEIKLQSKDKNRIDFFNEEIKWSNTDYIKDTNSYRFYVDSKMIIDNLISIGIPRGKKSKIVKPLDLSNNLLRYFWAGAFEGDGGISNPYDGSIRLNFAGNEAMCTGFKKYMEWNTKVCEQKFEKYESSFVVSKFFSNPKSFLPAFNKLYNPYSFENNLFLPRKVERMFDFFRYHNWN